MRIIICTLALLSILSLLIGCLPWQPTEERGGVEKNSGLLDTSKPKVDRSASEATSSTRQEPFQPVRIPAPGSFIEVTATITHPATILGKNGFSPAELTIEAGDSVTWTNADPQRKIMVLTFQKAGAREFITSISIPPGKEWDHVFTSPGEYTYWTVQHGTKGKLVVKTSE